MVVAQLPVPFSEVLATTFAGQVIDGGVWSFTVTVKLQVAVLLDGSDTVYVTVVTPRLKNVPDAKLMPVKGLAATVAPDFVQVIFGTLQLSPLKGVMPATLVVHVKELAATTWFAGQLTVGSALSIMVNLI